MEQFNTPILFIVFNRLSTTQLVFEKIRQAKPEQLFIAADGPRIDRPGDKEKCAKVRDYVLKNIDWACDVKTLMQENNLGCGVSVSKAITWFFENVDEGIILEDDCLPDISFFNFCSELLKRYRNEQRVMIISGFNNIGNFTQIKSDYLFTLYAGIWGWASWKRAWAYYNYHIPEWKNEKLKRTVLKSIGFKNAQIELKINLDGFVLNQSKLNTWDYQWWFYRLLNNGLGIVPKVSLIQNIGFDKEATHTIDSNNYVKNIVACKLSLPLKHPKRIRRNKTYEKKLYKNHYSNSPFLRQTVLNFCKRVLKTVLRKLITPIYYAFKQ